MNAAAVIIDAAAVGVRLWREGARIRYRAPVGALTPDLRARIATHRAEILELLTPAEKIEEQPPAPLTPPPPPKPSLDAPTVPRRPCFACGRSIWWSTPNLFGTVRCGVCHPPAHPRAYYLTGGEPTCSPSC